MIIVRITYHTRLQLNFAGSSTEGLVPSWYMAIAAVAASIVTAIVVIIIVLIICACKKNRGKSRMDKANGLNGNSRYETNNPTYSYKK